MKNFADLTEREVLAVAISSEEEDSRIYMTFAEDLAERYPDSAKIFEEMAEEEKGHRHMLLEMYEKRFGPNLPPIRRDNVNGFLRRRPIWLTKNLSLDTIRKEVGTMEFEAERFYVKAAEQTQDVGVRRLLGDLAEAEKGPRKTRRQADRPNSQPRRARRRGQDPPPHVRAAICPAGFGRTDGRLGVDAGAAVRRGLCHASELADVSRRLGRLDRRRHQHGLCRSAVRRRIIDRTRFALAARHHLRRHDDARRSRPHHALSGSRPWANAFWIATAIAGVVVFFELWAIAYIRARYMDTPFLQAVFQIVLGGAIVLAVGILIGAA